MIYSSPSAIWVPGSVYRMCPPDPLQNLHLMAFKRDFLILPWGQGASSGFHLLAGWRSRLSADWQQLYQHPVYYQETL